MCKGGSASLLLSLVGLCPAEIPLIQMIRVSAGNREIFRSSCFIPVIRDFLLKMISTGMLTPLGLGSKRKFQIAFGSGQL